MPELEQLSPTPVAVESPVAPVRKSRHPLLRYAIRRIGAGLLILFVMSILIFLAGNVLPGNVAEVLLGKNATPDRQIALEERLGLDNSLVERYLDWASGIVSFDLGESAVAVAQEATETSVAELISVPLRNTAILAGLAALLIVPLSILLGTLAGMRVGGKRDYAISYSTLALGAFPEFVLGIFLIAIFFTTLDWLTPVALVPPGQSPLSDLSILILPILTLAGVTLSYATRQVRIGMAEAMRQDYVAMARLAGIPERRVLWRYALRNALPTSVQVLAQTAQYLVGGIVVVEALFAYPGIGSYLVEAVQTRDTIAVQGIVLLLATVYIVINIIADILVVLLVPKLRTGIEE